MLSPNNLQAEEVGFNNNNLLFITSNVNNGYFSLLNPPLNTSTFYQNQITNNNVQFTHLGNNQAPSFTIIVSDGVHDTAPSEAIINFQGAPVIEQNTLSITQSGTTILSPSSIEILVTDGSTPDQVFITVNDLQHGTFSSTQNNQPVSIFTLSQLQAGMIQFTQDGSTSAPSYTVTAVGQNGLSSAPSTVQTQFSFQGLFAPHLLQNFLTVTQGQSTILTTQNLLAVQNDGEPVADDALFFVTQISQGQFSLLNDPQTFISSFTQAQLASGMVLFSADNSRALPGYQTAVAEFGLVSSSMPASIFFRTVNQPPVLTNAIPDQTVPVGQPFSFAIASNTFQDPQGSAITLTANLFNSTLPLPAGLNFDATNRRFSGRLTAPGSYDIGVTAQDTFNLTTQTDFTLDAVQPAPASTAKTSLETTIISASVSGVVGLGFFAARLGIQYLADKRMKAGKDEYELEVINPIAKAIAKRVKVTGFMDSLSSTTAEDFKGAVRTLLTEIHLRGINIRIDKMSTVDRDALVNEIATQTKLHLRTEGGCGRLARSFFKAEVTPVDLRKNAVVIAEGVVKVHGARVGQNRVALAPLKQNPLLAPRVNQPNLSWVEELDAAENSVSMQI